MYWIHLLLSYLCLLTISCVTVGEASGKASKGLAKLIPGSGGMQHLQAQGGSVMGEVARTRQVCPHEEGQTYMYRDLVLHLSDIS